MREYFALISKKQKEFILEEFEMTEEQFEEMDNKSLYDLYDTIADIEIDEIMKAGENDLSLRGEMATSIVTVVGNALAEAEGFVNEE